MVQPTGPSGSWALAWNDEFDDTTGMSGPTNGLAPSNWNCGMLTGTSSLGVGNVTAITGPNTASTEMEYYGPAGIVFPGDGAMHLRIQAGVDSGGSFAGKTVESGMVNTAGLMVLNPASVPVSTSSPDLRPYVINGTSVLEVRMRWPGPNGSAAHWWPVIWSTSAGLYNTGSPAGTVWPGGVNYVNEIDFIEYFSGGSLGSGGLFNLHQASTYGGVASVPAGMASTDLSLAYHTFTYQMTATTMTSWVDGTLVSTISPTTAQMRAQWDVPQYLMIAFQSHASGTFPTTAASTPSDMMIDYVRVFTPGSSAQVTRSGAQLMLNGSPFTYAGANIFWLGMIQEGLRYPTHTEIDDALATAVEMGAKVIRCQSMGMPVGFPLSVEPTQNVFNDAAFEPIDYAINRCANLGLHLIIPLCDTNVTYMGSTQVYSGWNGVATDAFFTNAGCISDFKAHIAHILNHTNQYSGTALKNDPTIMMWETGNELRVAGGLPVNTWTTTIAAYIKSLAPSVLVGDGFNGDGSTGITTAQAALTGVDAYTLHYYGAPYATYASQITAATTVTNANSKVCYIGEWDWLNTVSGTPTTLATFCTTIESSSLSGDTFWSLMCHDDSTGYDLHPDTFSMYYPGATTDAYTRGQTLRSHAYTMSGAAKPAQVAPVAPVITQFSPTATDASIGWHGSVGARFYQLESSTTSSTGPWTVLSTTLPQDEGIFDDTNGNRTTWYRVAGINGAAVKGPYTVQLPPSTGAAGIIPYGVTVASRATPLKNIEPQVFADAVTLGLGWVRFQCRWVDIETSQGVYDLAPTDDCVSRCMALGLKVQFAIQTPPVWRLLAGSCGACNATGVQCVNGQWRPHDPTQTGNFASMLSKRYNGVSTNNTLNKPLFIDAFEIGNEEMNQMSIPGAANTYAGQVCKQAKWFIPVLQKCAPIIRTNSPNALIGLPGLIKSGFGRAAFMQDLYANNCQGLFDYANIHTYPGAPGPDVPESDNNGETLSTQISEVWNVMNAHGDGALDVWVTEIGWAVPTEVTEAVRQKWYVAALDDMRTSKHVGVVNWFTMNYTDPLKNSSSPTFSLTHLNPPPYTPTFGTLQTYINKWPNWEAGSVLIAERDQHTRFKLKTSGNVQVKADVAARLLMRTPGSVTQRVRDSSTRFKLQGTRPTTPHDDYATRLNVRIAGTTQNIRDDRTRLRISAVGVPTPVLKNLHARYSSREIIPGSGGGAPTSIMMLLMENRSWQQIFGSGKANWPLVNALVAKYNNTTNFFGTYHPSLPNYIALLAGSRLGVTADGGPGSSGVGGPFPNKTLVDSLEAGGISWKAYFENMPSVGYTGGDTNGYAQRHNPFVYFSSITGVPARLQKLVPLTVGTNANLIADLNATNPPKFVWVTPNIADDGHTGGSPDKYATDLVAKVQQTNWYAAGGAIIVMWDEGAKTDFSGIGDANGPNNGGGPTGMFIVSNSSKNFGNFTTPVNQYGTMKAVCEAFGITQLVNEAHTSNGDPTPIFGTASKNLAPIDFTTRFRLQPIGRTRDYHARLHSTPAVVSVIIINDMATRLRIAPLAVTNSTKDIRKRFLLRSAPTKDLKARVNVLSGQTVQRRDLSTRVSFTSGSDTFNRANQTGWGVASNGETWVQIAGAGVATATITNNTGQVTGTQAQVALMLLGTTTVTDAQAQVDVTFSSSMTDGPALILRVAPNAISYYRALMGNNILTLSLLVNATTTNLVTLPLSLVTGIPYTLKFLLSGQNLSTKIWQVGTAEPGWMLTTTDATLTAAGQYGIRTRVGSTSDLINYDNYILATSFVSQQKTPNVPARFCLCNDGDTFSRPSPFFGAWGDSASGSTWIQAGAFSSLDTTDSQGLMDTSSGETFMLLGTEQEADVNCCADLTIAATNDSIGIFVRFVDVGNWYLVRYFKGFLQLVVAQDGAETIFASVPTTMSLGVSYTVRIQVVGKIFSATLWATGTTEPVNPLLRTSSATYDGIGQWGLYGDASSNASMRYDNFVAISQSTNKAQDVAARMVLQDFGTLDLSGRILLTNGTLRDARSRLILGIVSTKNTASRLRVAAVKSTSDAQTRTRLVAATQQKRPFAARLVLQNIKMRHITTRTYLLALQQRNLLQRLIVRGQPFLDTPVRMTLAVPHTQDAQGRLNFVITQGRDVIGRLYTVPSPLVDMTLRTNLTAAVVGGTALRFVLQTTSVRNVAARLYVTGMRQSNTSTRVLLASPVQAKDTGLRLRLVLPVARTNTPDVSARLLIAIDQDTFTRANQSGWGTASGGSTWAHPTGSTAFTLAIVSNAGQMTGGTSNGVEFLGSDTFVDGTVVCDITMSAPTLDNANIVLRATSGSTYYRAIANGSGNFALTRMVGNVSTQLAATSFPLTASTFYTFKCRIIGSNLSAKIWLSSSTEPVAWTLTANDATITGAGQFGVAYNSSANAHSATYANFLALDAQASLSTNTLVARLRLATPSSRDTTARLRLQVAATLSTHTMGVRLPLLALTLRDVKTRTRVLNSHTSDAVARLVIQAGDTLNLPVRLRYNSLLVMRDTRVRLMLGAQNSYPLLTRVLLQPSVAKDVSGRLVTTSQALPVTKELIGRLNMALAQDTFNRANQTGWGNSSDGHVWTQLNGSGVLTILSNEGVITSSATQTQNSVYLSSIQPTNVEVLCRITPAQTAGNSGIFLHIGGGGFRFLLDSGTNFRIDYVAVGGSPVTNIISTTFTYTAHTSYRLRTRIYNNNLLGKVWLDGTAEPVAWTLGILNTSTSSAGFFGARDSGASTVFTFDNFVAYDAQALLQGFDLPQRLYMAAQQQKNVGMRLPITAIVTNSVSFLDTPLVLGDSLIDLVVDTLIDASLLPGTETCLDTLFYAATDILSVLPASSMSTVTLLSDVLTLPGDLYATSSVLLQTDLPVIADITTESLALSSSDLLSPPVETGQNATNFVPTDSLTLAAETLTEIVLSTLVDTPLSLTDVEMATIQETNSDTLATTETLALMESAFLLDTLSSLEVLALTSALLIATTPLLPQDSSSDTLSFSLSENVTSSDNILGGLSQVGSDTLTGSELATLLTILVWSDTSSESTFVLFTETLTSSESVSSADSLSSVASALMIGTDSVTVTDSTLPTGLFVPLDTLVGSDTLTNILLAALPADSSVLVELLSMQDALSTTDTATTTETVNLLTLLASIDAALSTSGEVLLITTTLTFASDTLAPSDVETLLQTALLGDTLSASELGLFLEAEQLTENSVLVDTSSSTLLPALIDAALVALETVSETTVVTLSDLVTLLDAATATLSMLATPDMSTVLDSTSLFGVVTSSIDSLGIVEISSSALALLASDLLTTSEITRLIGLVAANDTPLTISDTPLLTLLQTENESTPVGAEGFVYINPSIISGIETLFLTESSTFTLTVTTVDASSMSEQLVLLTLIKLLDTQLTVLETATFLDVMFAAVNAYRRDGTITLIWR